MDLEESTLFPQLQLPTGGTPQPGGGGGAGRSQKPANKRVVFEDSSDDEKGESNTGNGTAVPPRPTEQTLVGFYSFSVDPVDYEDEEEKRLLCGTPEGDAEELTRVLAEGEALVEDITPIPSAKSAVGNLGKPVVAATAASVAVAANPCPPMSTAPGLFLGAEATAYKQRQQMELRYHRLEAPEVSSGHGRKRGRSTSPGAQEGEAEAGQEEEKGEPLLVKDTKEGYSLSLHPDDFEHFPTSRRRERLQRSLLGNDEGTGTPVGGASGAGDDVGAAGGVVEEQEGEEDEEEEDEELEEEIDDLLLVTAVERLIEGCEADSKEEHFSPFLSPAKEAIQRLYAKDISISEFTEQVTPLLYGVRSAVHRKLRPPKAEAVVVDGVLTDL